MFALAHALALGAGGRVRAPLVVPSGYGYTPDFNVYRDGSTYTSSFDITARKPTYTRTIYVGPGGNNSADGLSYANRVRSIKVAISKANAFTGETVRILIDPAYYWASQIVSSNADSWSSFNPTVDLVIEINGEGRAYSVQDIVVPAFVATSDPNVYVSTYTTEAVSRSVIDMAQTIDGDPARLYPVFSPADPANPYSELNAMWSSRGAASYLDTTNKKIWVRLPDNRAPDSNMKVLTSGGGVLTSTASARVLWMERLSFWGGTTFRVTSGASGNPTVYADDCDFLYANGADGFGWTGGGGTAYLNACRALWNERDGFNYHGISGGASPVAHEFGCVGDWNGWDNSNANNGSTAHENSTTFRLNCFYRDNADRNVHDINDSRNWGLGCLGGPSRRGLDASEQSANFAAGGSGVGVTKSWWDGCTFGAGSQYDLESYTGCEVRYTNMSAGTTFGTGTIAAY